MAKIVGMISLVEMEFTMRHLAGLVIFLLLFYTATAQELARPIVRNHFQQWTSHGEMLDWIKILSKGREDVKVNVLGMSSNGREILSVMNTDWQEHDLKIMIIAAQHGDEPSAMEAALWLIEQMPIYKKQFGSVHFVVIPMVNPDGHELGTRRNGRGMDLNRDHLLLLERENQLVHSFYQNYQPHVLIDIHEYPFEMGTTEFPWEKRTQEQLGIVTNLNCKGSFHHSFSSGVLLPAVDSIMNQRVISFSEYAVGSIAKRERIRHSTVDIDDGRQGLGAVGGSLSFIIEGLNGKSRNDNIQRRVDGQIALLSALLEVVLKNNEVVVNAVNGYREQEPLADEVIISMDHFVGNENWRTTMYHRDSNEAKNFSYGFYQFEILPIKKVQVPSGYLILVSDTLLNQWLMHHGIEKIRVFKGLSTGTFLFKQWKHEGWKTQTLEGMEVPGWKGHWEVNSMSVSDMSNYWYVPCGQAQLRRIVMALEPESMFGLVRYPEYAHWRAQYPILRVERD